MEKSKTIEKIVADLEKLQSPKKIIYIDMDDVLCDYQEAVVGYFKQHYPLDQRSV